MTSVYAYRSEMKTTNGNNPEEHDTTKHCRFLCHQQHQQRHDERKNNWPCKFLSYKGHLYQTENFRDTLNWNSDVRVRYLDENSLKYAYVLKKLTGKRKAKIRDEYPQDKYRETKFFLIGRYCRNGSGIAISRSFMVFVYRW